MAGDWIKMELTLPDKAEVHYIANLLKVDPDAVVGKLLRVWSWFDQNTTDGNAVGVTFALVDRLTSVTGFGEAMQFAGWLEQDGKVLRMLNFDKHTSESAKKRALTSKRQSRFRNADSNALVTQQALPEKRREEIKTPIPPSGEFLVFWKTWPSSTRKVSQGKCWEAWKKWGLDKNHAQIVSHVESMKASFDWRKEGGAFIPAPLVYLRQRRWEGAEVQAAGERKVAM